MSAAATGQGERTRQAWTRTTLSALGIVVVGFRLALDRSAVTAAAIGGLSLLAAAAFGLLGQRRMHELLAPEPAPLRGSTVLAIALAVVVVDVVGATLILA